MKLIAALALAAALPGTASASDGRNARVELGKTLFYDLRLSAGRPMSCVSCHDLSGSGENNLPNALLSDGVHHSKHAVPTVWNAALLTSYFWSGGAATLEEQAEGPLTELGLGDAQNVVVRISSIPGYAPLFKEAFGDAGVTLERVTAALGAFERTLLTPDSPYDRFRAGETGALSLSARRGMALFAKLGCAACHSGPAFAGPAGPQGAANMKPFPVHPGSVYDAKYRLTEEGRAAWRVAPLLNVARTAPYFHNGSAAALDEAVRVMAKTQLNLDLTPEQTGELTEFLNGLSGELPKIAQPPMP